MTTEDQRIRGGVIGTLVRRGAEIWGDRTAFVFPDDGSWTFAETAAEAGRAAAWLAARGLGRGDRLALVGETSRAWLQLWLGAAHLGAVVVAVNPGWRGQALVDALTTTSPKLVLADEDLLHRIARHSVGAEVLVPVVGHGPPPAMADVETSDAVAVNFTSGTTGPSRGVVTPYGLLNAAARHLLVEGLDMAPDDVDLQVAPLFHMGGQLVIVAGLVSGAQTVVLPRFTGSGFLDLCRRHRVTTCQLVGTMAEFLARAPARADDTDTPLDRVALTPPPRDPEGFKARFGLSRIVTGFGMTETGPIAIGEVVDASGACGHPRAGVAVELRRAGQVLPPGEAGELWVKPSDRAEMMVGYLGAESGWEDGWFATGDVLRQLPDGRLQFVDRAGDYLRRRGENVSTFEVERGALGHPAVAEAACVGHPDGFGGDDVKLFVVGRGEGPRAAELHAYLAEHVADYAVPRYIELIDELPRGLVTGRVLKEELRRRGNSKATWDAQAAASDASGQE